MNLLAWYSRIPSDDENVRRPGRGIETHECLEVSTKPSYDFGWNSASFGKFEFSIDVGVDINLPDSGWANSPGKGTVVLDSTGKTETSVMKTPLDGGLGYLDLAEHMDPSNIKYNLLEIPAKLALILSPVLTIPLIWIDPMVNWFDLQRMDAS